MRALGYFLLLLLVAATQYGYHAEGVPAQQAWTLYVMRGVQDVALFAMIWLGRPARLDRNTLALLAFTCTLGAFEEAQNAVCGLAEWKQPLYVGDLCLHKFGAWPYAVLAAAGLTWFITRKRDDG